jgi:hypothetical protein
MALLSLAEYKVIYGITDTDATRDAQITAYLPMIEAEIVEYCNNEFLNKDITFSGSFVPTVSAGPVYTLVCALGGISAIGLSAGDQIKLEGTIRNDGRLTTTVIADTVITVSDVLVAESAVDAKISLIQYPAGLKMYAARMVAYQLAHGNDAGLTSESIKSYSYSRASGGASDAGYPQELLKGLDKWRLIKTGRGQRREQFIDRRGNFVGDIITDKIRTGVV